MRKLRRHPRPCGCRTHTDHLACEDVCWDFGCTGAIGMVRKQWGWRK